MLILGREHGLLFTVKQLGILIWILSVMCGLTITHSSSFVQKQMDAHMTHQESADFRIQ